MIVEKILSTKKIPTLLVFLEWRYLEFTTIIRSLEIIASAKVNMEGHRKMNQQML